jgi:DegV family protein with EDD domain
VKDAGLKKNHLAAVSASVAGLHRMPSQDRKRKLKTFEYLHRGGRVGGAVALVATLLEIRPVLCLADGHIEVLVKTRTKRRALQTILERMAAKVNGHPLHVAIFHGGVPAEAEEFRQRIIERFHCVELYVTEFTAVIGAHTGPGVLGVAFYAE